MPYASLCNNFGEWFGLPCCRQCPQKACQRCGLFPLVPSTVPAALFLFHLHMPEKHHSAFCAGLALQGVFRKKISKANSNYILKSLGSWGDLGFCLVSTTWLNVAISQYRQWFEANNTRKCMRGRMRLSKVTVWSIQADESNTLRHLTHFLLFTVEGFQILSQTPSYLSGNVSFLEKYRMKTNFSKAAEFAFSIGFHNDILTQVCCLDLCSTEPSITTTRN